MNMLSSIWVVHKNDRKFYICLDDDVMNWPKQVIATQTAIDLLFLEIYNLWLDVMIKIMFAAEKSSKIQTLKSVQTVLG